jgi:chemotaxis family two-component system response regulator Rcp1
LGCSNVCTQAMNIQAPGLDLPFANESWIGITDGFGSNPNPDEDQPSASRSRREEQNASRTCILIVEDNSADVFLIRAAIRTANIDADLRILKDGEQAIHFFDDADRDERAPCPALVILDINLPRRQGGEVLEHIRKSRRCNKALVIVASTSDSQKDRDIMAALGANGYFAKPSAYAGFMKLGDMMRELLNSGSPAA